MLVVQGQKRNRPEVDLEDANKQRQRRTSEVHSDSTCNSDAMLVERIHSGLPAPPEKQKVEGAFEAAYRTSEQPRNGDVRTSNESGFRALTHEVLQGGGLHVSSGPGSSQLRVQQLPAPAHRNAGTYDEYQVTSSINREGSLRASGVTESQPSQPRAGALTTMPLSALQHQMKLLLRDEQSLLMELRLMRRDYDTRVAILSRDLCASKQHAALPQPPLPRAHPSFSLAAKPMSARDKAGPPSNVPSLLDVGRGARNDIPPLELCAPLGGPSMPPPPPPAGLLATQRSSVRDVRAPLPAQKPFVLDSPPTLAPGAASNPRASRAAPPRRPANRPPIAAPRTTGPVPSADAGPSGASGATDAAVMQQLILVQLLRLHQEQQLQQLL